MPQQRLNFGDSRPEARTDGTLPPPPSLDGIESLGIDTETTNEPRMYDRRLVGISYRLPDGRKGYLPTRHPGGGNYDEEMIRRWAKAELRGKEYICANAKHEADTFLRFGVDLEAQGCTPNDVFAQAALLNDHRYKLNLNIIAEEELGRGKVVIGNTEEYPIHERTVAEITPYAVEDADLVWELNQAYAPRIESEGLGEVLQLENDIVYATAEMERQGAYLDVEKLARWAGEVQVEYERRLLLLQKSCGFTVEPGSWKSMARMFDHLGLRYPFTAPTLAHPDGCPSFPEDWLETVAGHWVGVGDDAQFIVDQPVVNAALEARQLASLKSKYLDNYLEVVEPDGRIRYQLHQLRGDANGTITGRYSSSKINIQQVSVKSKQPRLLQRWPIRELFIPPPGRVFASADAKQIELRIFAHYANRISSRLVDAYRANPDVDFHSLVVDWTKLIRPFAKNVSFCKLYGGGPDKVALMCKVGPDEGKRIVKQYDREFPEAKRLLKMAETQAESIGFVRTVLGRRRRYLPGDRFYSALNSVFQGTAADLMKLKIREQHRIRKSLDFTMRYTVHDELNGDLPSARELPAWQTALNQQTVQLLVPILWDAKTGINWHEAH